MNTKSDAVTRKNDSPSLHRLGRRSAKIKLTPAQRHKYQREIAIYRGMFGCRDIAEGDLQRWAEIRASIPEMVEVDREVAAYRRWESRFWRSPRCAR